MEPLTATLYVWCATIGVQPTYFMPMAAANISPADPPMAAVQHVTAEECQTLLPPETEASLTSVAFLDARKRRSR